MISGVASHSKINLNSVLPQMTIKCMTSNAKGRELPVILLWRNWPALLLICCTEPEDITSGHLIFLETLMVQQPQQIKLKAMGHFSSDSEVLNFLKHVSVYN